MKKRVIFQNKSDRISFFKEALKASGFRFWKELRNFTNIPKSRFEFYKNGMYTLPYYRYQKLNNILSTEKQNYFNKTIQLIDENWGRKKGGITTYKNHKEIFMIGRKLSWKNRISKYHFDVNLELNENLCEFLGAFIGDGFTNKYGSSYVIQFTGDSRYDYEYYEKCMIPIAKTYFNIKPRIKRIDNTLRINLNSKTLHILLTQRFKFPAGKKSYTVKIPQEILNSCREHITALLRGIYDTDGCVFFDKRPSYRNPYPRIHIELINRPLIRQIYNTLQFFDLNPTITKNGYIIQINGEKYTKKFLKTIGFSNSRHINRIRKTCPKLLD
ncbi:MAG: hypothetical protein KAT43_02045 [Nanoarchaeota archaeon]|nr:hypothetical protein [Nanoarchaeota archaeon]